MHEMDLIPADYRAQRQRQRQRRWWLLALGAAMLSLAAARLTLVRLQAQVQAEVQALAPQRERVTAQQEELRTVEAQIAQAQQLARRQGAARQALPWGQLPAILAPLPAGVWLEQLQLERRPAREAAASAAELSETELTQLTLDGQARDHEALSQTLARWRSLSELRGLELVQAQPRSTPQGDSVAFQVRLHLPAARAVREGE